MLRNTFVATVILACLIGCRPPATTTGSEDFGNNGAIVKEVFDSALDGYQLQGAVVQSSGGTINEEFSRRGTVTIKEADQKEIADLLDKQLETLPVTHKWTSHGSARTGDRYLGLSYKEDGNQFYIDLILTQKDKDVEILVLSKGVRK